jgi:hypothetical protein
MPWPKYIYNEYTKKLETLTGENFIDSDCKDIIFENVDQVYRYLKENNIEGLVGRKLKMD